MKIDNNFLREQYQSIAETYNLSWRDLDEYGGVLENDKIEISLIAERWEDGLSMSLTNKLTDEYYSLFDIYEKKGFNNGSEYLTASEQESEREFSMNEALAYNFRILLERYGQDVLSGDFSIIGKGKSN